MQELKRKFDEHLGYLQKSLGELETLENEENPWKGNVDRQKKACILSRRIRMSARSSWRLCIVYSKQTHEEVSKVWPSELKQRISRILGKAAELAEDEPYRENINDRFRIVSEEILPELPD